MDDDDDSFLDDDGSVGVMAVSLLSSLVVSDTAIVVDVSSFLTSSLPTGGNVAMMPLGAVRSTSVLVSLPRRVIMMDVMLGVLRVVGGYFSQ